MKGATIDSLSRRIHEAAAVLRESGAREVYLFGSAATGRAASATDIDLAVSGLPPARFFRAMSKAAVAIGRPIDLIDLDEDTPFTRYLRSEGELRRVG
ncbi:MAG: nucleotidyltransferase domain-containing protein [Acidobacteria bacterium]|nr:nucleotidyltransferase domain-containing protein [Acidobacteriota bacterium]